MAERIKIELEYPVKSSKKIIYDRLSTAGGLAEWFADDVIVSNNQFNFVWDKQSHLAEMVANKYLKFVRFRWKHLPDDLYFEFKLISEELSGETTLIVTDFVEEHEKEESISLWGNQINDLKRIIGT